MAFEPDPSIAAPRLLLLQPDPALVRSAVRSGLDVWMVVDPDRRTAGFPVAEDRVVRAASSDPARLHRAAAAAIAKYDIAHALNAEGTPIPCTRAAESRRRGGRSPVEAVRLLNDTRAARLILNQTPGSEIEARRVEAARDVVAVVGGFGFPAVIRARAGLTVVRSDADLDAWLRRDGAGAARGPYVVEESLTGPHLAVTTLTVDGMHRVVAIAAKRRGGATPGYIVPAGLSESEAMAVRAAVTGLLDLVGYEFGPALTQVVLTLRGPRIVRTSARFGHSRIPRLIEIAAGVDVRTELFRALAGSPLRPPEPRWFAAVGFLTTVGAPSRLVAAKDILTIRGVNEFCSSGADSDASLTGSAASEPGRPYVIVEGFSAAAVAQSLAAVRQRIG